MYIFNSAWVRPRNKGYYKEVDISSIPFTELFLTYDHIYLHLSHTQLPGEVLGFDLSQMQPSLSHRTDTLLTWLTGLGSSALPTEQPAKTVTTASVKYTDAVYAQCKLTRVHRHSHPESEYPLDDKRNLLIKTPNEEDGYVDFYENHLITLGGFIHRSEHTAHGVLVPHAVETLETSNIDTVGLISFKDLGGISQRHLKEEDLMPDGNGNPLGKRFAIDFDEPIGDRQVGIVLLGRLIVDPKILYKFNDHRLIVDMERVDLEGIYQHVLSSIPLDSLPIQPVRGNTDVVLIDQLRSDETIRKIMSLPQSFAVVFNAERLIEDFKPLANTDVSGRVISHEYPTEPVIGAHGYYVDYWTREDWGVWVLNFPEQWVKRYFHDTYDEGDRFITTGHHSTVIPRYTPHFRLHRLETHTLE